jgi:hypothetical protein
MLDLGFEGEREEKKRERGWKKREKEENSICHGSGFLF